MVRTIAELFYEALKHRLPDALVWKDGGRYRALSHEELRMEVEKLAMALRARGLLLGDRVALLSENRPEWAITDYACAISGLVTVPVYPTLNAEQTALILRHSGARWVICSSREQVEKVQAQWESLPMLEAVVSLDGEDESPRDRRLAWSELMAQGEALRALADPVPAWGAQRLPTDLLTIIYTSGTTGDPKGVMLTHGNLVSNIEASLVHLRPLPGDRCLSMLPLSHIFERMAGHYLMFHCGVSITYVHSLQTLAQELQEVAPTVILTVPRVFEKIYSRVRDAISESSWIKRLLFRWATQAAGRQLPYRMAEQQPPLGVRFLGALADHLVFSKIRARTGGKLRFAVSGGAALSPRIMDFFWSMGVPIYEGYGLTETSPVLTINRKGEVKAGSVGRPILDTWEGQPFLKLSGDGEILVRGPNIMAGYWRNEEATREAIDADGYFHTGDIGQLDEQGRVLITDRKKDILVTSGGKNVAPQPIENLLRMDKYISQVVLIGDGRNYIVALVVPHFPVLRRWAAYKGLAFTDDASLAALPQAAFKIQRRVERVNATLSNFERVRKVFLVDRELSVEEGFLTPSLKIKRRAIAEAFAERIDELYANSNAQEYRIHPLRIPPGPEPAKEHRKAS